ncbi:Gigasin-6 [Hypsizygus marmoreus]|uniref:Gigasin-6 n=1 Tax=Hypsizygus marmoreus TaxID=39966 RepID=A0A369JGY9_HYPMA|nr:Gigasin-6 [Hypsizygus marmoreus]
MVPLQVLFKLLPFYLISSVSALPQSSTSCSHTTSSFESTSSPLPTSTSSPPSTNTSFPATIFDDSTDAFINEVLADWKSPGGIAVAFVRQNELGEWTNVEAKGYGVATANGTKVTKDTTFNIGSNSKLFNVLAASFLIGNETLSPRINWDTKIQSIIPEFNLTDPIAARESTLLDLMTHRTGYPLHDFAYRYSDDIPNVIAKLQHQRQSASFRDIWQYNNNMYTTLSYLPSLLSNTTYARYVKENIFDPLNMTATTFSYQLANSHGQRADGMGRQGRDVYADPFGGTPRAVQYWTATTGGEDGSVLAGAGGVITSAVDMATWLQTLLLDGRHPTTNENVIPPDVLRKITSAISVQTTRPEFPEVSLIAYGAAQLQITYRGHLIIEHGGFIRGFNSQISRLPYDGLGVAVLTNDNEHGKVQTEIIKNHILDKALGLDPIDWSGRWKALRSVPPARATPRPSNATAPSVDFPQLAGMYNNDGYGPIELCLVSPTNADSSASGSCEALASNISTILPGGIRQGIPTLVGAVDSPWYSHIRVEHFDADLFNVSLLISTPTDDPKEPFWTYNDKSQSDNLQTAELNVEGSHIGLGLAGFWAGLWDGAEAGVPKPKGDTVRERAEVYFDKITA